MSSILTHPMSPLSISRYFNDLNFRRSREKGLGKEAWDEMVIVSAFAPC